MSLSHVTIGSQFPEILNVVIEIPRGSRNKYEYDWNLEVIMLDRVLHSSLFYPTDYGFVPETKADDGDNLDILVLVSQPTFPGCVVQARPIGIMDMEDEEGKDWKIIAVAHNDPYYKHVHTIAELNGHMKREIQHFFETYKQLEDGKRSTVLGWDNKEKALEIITTAHQEYRNNR